MRRTQDSYDDIAERASNGVHATRRTLSRAMDDIADTMTDWRDKARPTTDRLTERATVAARDGADWMMDKSGRMRDGVARASDRTVGYVRDEPVRSALMVVAAGTLLYALLRMMKSRADD